MNILLFESSERLDATRIEVRGRRLEHLRDVHTVSAGDPLTVGEIDGRMGQGRVIDIDASRALLEVDLRHDPPPRLPLTLVVALPRPKMLRRILRTVAEFGVGELHLINSYRVEKSYWQTPVLDDDTLREYLLLGLEQARDTRLPRVHLHHRFKPWVEDALPALCLHRQALVAHPGDYPACPAQLQRDTLAVIGPEGGFTPYEVDKLQASGCAPVSLGQRILRVENAVTALLGRAV